MKIKRSFDYRFIENFAKLSGDYNSIHLRKNNFNESIVHGIAIVLSALERISKKFNKISTLSVEFKNFLYVNNIISIEYIYKNKNIFLINIFNEDLNIAKIKIKFSDKIIFCKNNIYINKMPSKSKIETFDYSEWDKEAKVKLFLSKKLTKKIFPEFNNNTDYNFISVLLCLTKIIGMKLPGKYSIFSGFNLEFKPSKINDKLIKYKLKDYDKRWNYLTINVFNNFLKSEISAFERPKPVIQPSFKYIKTKINKLNFKNKKVLVIGGSNGIGEICVKILCYYGAKVTFTYHQNLKNSKRILKDCNNKNLKFLKLDISDIDNKRLVQIFLKERFDQIYYFATPKIFNNVAERVNIKILSDFFDYYILNIINILNLIDKKLSKKTYFLLPSTIATKNEENNKNLREYKLIKKLSDELFNLDIFENIIVKIHKFNRVKTNQTTSIHQIPKYSDIITETKNAINLMK